MKAMLFADGENLLARYEHMHLNGRIPLSNVTHQKGAFVWSSRITESRGLSFRRVSYYTTQQGSDETLRALEQQLAQVVWRSDVPPHGGTLVPRVFKKPAKVQKTASVDINIAIDVLRHCHNRDVEMAFILSGDRDYLPLVREAMRNGVRVAVGAFSSGLNTDLKVIPDIFLNLDELFFQPDVNR